MSQFLKKLQGECYEEPELIRNAPHNAPIHDTVVDEINDFDKIAVTLAPVAKTHC